MDRICDNKKCTGCGLCSNICPKGAISMVEAGKHGHYQPQIDKEKCIDCKLCVKRCPSMALKEFYRNQITYAAWRLNDKKRAGSSSGGVAAAFYEKALQLEYYVVGTILDENLSARLLLTSNQEEALSFKGSKYLQANPGTVYKEAVSVMRSGFKVLFIGTPCQCAAMRSAAEGISSNLLTVELVCHGAPSQKILREYLKLQEKRIKKKVDWLSFRTERGEELTLFSKGEIVWKHLPREDEYLYAFSFGLLQNEACFSCEYAKPDRASDITIGDFWGLGVNEPFEKPDCRVSLIGVNTSKGNSFIKQCTDLKFEVRDYQEAVHGNTNLRHPSAKHMDYDTFWECYHKNGLEDAFNNTITPQLQKTRIKRAIERAVKYPIKKLFRMG